MLYGVRLKEQLILDECRILWSQHRQVYSVTASSYQQWYVKQLHCSGDSHRVRNVSLS